MSVADSGPGIPDAEKERVFERFHRSDPKAKGSQGTGLGLAIAHGIVAGHGGRIWVEDRPGGGSEFAILLPSFDSAPSGGDASSEGEEA
jgi:two-component system sensor histidine kinase KdpD